MKTLLFCTSYAASPEAWEQRYGRWLDFFQGSEIERDQILFIDDGSPCLPGWRGLRVLHELPEREPTEKTVLFHFASNLGRLAITNYPGWFRSFTFAVEYARKYGFEKIVHVESDSFVFSRRIVEFINSRSSGWTAFWCPRWNFPESCIQVVAQDRFDDYDRLRRTPYESIAGQRIETLLPLTDVRTDFIGDRYGEYLGWLPEKVDYACQVPEEWELDAPEDALDGASPLLAHWQAPAPAHAGLGTPSLLDPLDAARASAPELTVICVSYRRYREIHVLIHCLLAQTLQNFKLLVLHDGPDEKMEDILARYKREYPGIVDYQFTSERYNDYGHSLRDIGIRQLDTPYVLITNDDNYYCPRFLEFMFAPMRREPPAPDIVMCDMVHSHFGAGLRNQQSYRYFETFPQSASVDIGCFIARSDLAKQVGFRDKGFDGDATYLEDLARAAGRARICKVDHVLFVHN